MTDRSQPTQPTENPPPVARQGIDANDLAIHRVLEGEEMDEQKKRYQGLIAENVCLLGDGGQPIEGYLAKPMGPGPYPGIIVVHEIFGLVEHIREVTRKFAAAGYISLAPDLYSRENLLHDGIPDEAEMRAIRQITGDLPDDRIIADMEGAAEYIKTVSTWNGSLGCIGYCAGGRYALLFACNTQSLDAAVDCYGGRVIPDALTKSRPKGVIDMIPTLSCPLLGLFGATDANPNQEQVAKTEDQLRRYNKEYQFKTYPAPAGHAFFADYRPSYVQEAAADGWERVFTFFSQHLS